MLDKPPLKDERIIACLKTSYGLTVSVLEFLPLGYDANAGVYRVDAAGQSYFLKVKRDTVSELSIRLPRFLNEQGMATVVAPLPTVTQALWGTVDQFTLILYPFIDGTSGWGADLTGDQWAAFGADLKHLHSTHLPPDLLRLVPKETFVPPAKHTAIISQLQAAIGTRRYHNPVQRELAAFWIDHRDDITLIVDRVAQLGRGLQARSSALEYVLCHADSHAGNLLIDAQGTLFIVDWDQPVLAPRERDLMFVTVGGFMTDPRAETSFFRGYGPAVIDPLTMTYYRYERVMEDLAEFAAQVFSDDTSDETKQDSVRWFMVQFEPGSVLEAARTLDRELSG